MNLHAITVIALYLLANQAMACSEKSVPVQYVAAIESQDVSQMAVFMADSIHYQDPTMAYFGIPEVDLKGLDETVKFWTDSFRDSKVVDMDYTIESCFQAGPTVVMELDLIIDMAGSTWDVDKPQIQLGGKHVMSLKLENDLIVHQVDYVDYESVTRQVTALQEAHGTVSKP